MAADHGLQIDEDMAFQHRSWFLERIGWVIFAIIILAALAGLFGGGFLSEAQKRNGGLEVDYERFARRQTAVEFAVTAPVEAGEVRLRVDRDYLSNIDLDRVIPEPDSVEASEDAYTYVFSAAQGASEVHVVFIGRPDHIGFIEAEIAVEGGPDVSFTQLVYP